MLLSEYSEDSDYEFDINDTRMSYADEDYAEISKPKADLAYVMRKVPDFPIKSDPYLEVARYCLILGTIFSVITALIGVSSWILIQQWRRFKNYVFMMIVLNFATLYCLFETIRFEAGNYTLKKAMDFFLISCAWWLVVASVIVYMDLVKVFKSKITNRTLKSNLIVWGIAATTTLISVMDDQQLQLLKDWKKYDLELIMPLLACCVLYAGVLCTLMKESKGVATAQNRRYKAQAATLAFVTSGGMMLVAVLAAEPSEPSSFHAIALIAYAMQTSATNLIFLILKANRVAWADHFKKFNHALSEP